MSGRLASAERFIKSRFAQFLIALLAAAAGSSAEPLNYRVCWVGNTFSGRDKRVAQDIDDLCVTPQGDVFTNVGWDEAGDQVQQYAHGDLVKSARHTHGWGYSGGSSVAANDKYLFIVQQVGNEGGGLVGDSWPVKGLLWSGVSRRTRADISQAAPFSGGRGKEGDVLKSAFLPIVIAPDGKLVPIAGLDATAELLYVSSPADDVIKVIDAETMLPRDSWPIVRPGNIALDRQNHLWILQKPGDDGRWHAVCLDLKSGKPLPQQITFDAGFIPGDFCIDSSNRLLVSDLGPTQQVHIFESLDAAPKETGTFGELGGITAGPVVGRFGDRRFNNPHGIGSDDAGNLYIASSGSTAGGGTVLECYSKDGALKWRMLGLEFIDLADLDPSAEDKDGLAGSIFTKEERFAIDWSKPAGQEWSYAAYTVNPWKYPDDPRCHIRSGGARVVSTEGQTLLTVTDMNSQALQVYRFNPATDGEIAIPTGLFAREHINHSPPHQPDQGGWLWTDSNANGQFDAGEFTPSPIKTTGTFTIDDRGTVWAHNDKNIYGVPLKSIKDGVPRWSLADVQTTPLPAELDEARLIQYLPDQDVMLLAGNKGDDHNQHWKPMGPVLACYDQWKTDQPRLRWSIVLPYEKGVKSHWSNEPITFDVAGEFVFVAYTSGLKIDDVKNAFVKIYRLKDCGFVGNLIAETKLGDTGLLDLPLSVRAVKRLSGEYVVFLEDDYRTKTVMFRWKP